MAKPSGVTTEGYPHPLFIATQFVRFIRRELDAELPIQYLAIVLEVAQEEGLQQALLAKRVGVSPPTLSRNIKALSRWADPSTGKMKGHDLIRVQPDVYDRQSNACYLTERGKNILNKLFALLQPAAPVEP